MTAASDGLPIISNLAEQGVMLDRVMQYSLSRLHCCAEEAVLAYLSL